MLCNRNQAILGVCLFFWYQISIHDDLLEMKLLVLFQLLLSSKKAVCWRCHIEIADAFMQDAEGTQQIKIMWAFPKPLFGTYRKTQSQKILWLWRVAFENKCNTDG